MSRCRSLRDRPDGCLQRRVCNVSLRGGSRSLMGGCVLICMSSVYSFPGGIVLGLGIIFLMSLFFGTGRGVEAGHTITLLFY